VISFYLQMLKKKEHALKKYPAELWAQLDEVQMIEALQRELEELKLALFRGDLTLKQRLRPG